MQLVVLVEAVVVLQFGDDVDAEMVLQVLADTGEVLDDVDSMTAKRFGRADEFASLVEAILRTPFLNGQTIRLDGALSTPLTDMTPPQRG